MNLKTNSKTFKKMIIDAERYRWLRDNIEAVCIQGGATDSGVYSRHLQIIEPIPILGEGSLINSEIDKAIDDVRLQSMDKKI